MLAISANIRIHICVHRLLLNLSAKSPLCCAEKQCNSDGKQYRAPILERFLLQAIQRFAGLLELLIFPITCLSGNTSIMSTSGRSASVPSEQQLPFFKRDGCGKILLLRHAFVFSNQNSRCNIDHIRTSFSPEVCRNIQRKGTRINPSARISHSFPKWEELVDSASVVCFCFLKTDL